MRIGSSIVPLFPGTSQNKSRIVSRLIAEHWGRKRTNFAGSTNFLAGPSHLFVSLLAELQRMIGEHKAKKRRPAPIVRLSLISKQQCTFMCL